MIELELIGAVGAGDHWGTGLQPESGPLLAAPLQPLGNLDGLEELGGQDRERRITEQERSRIISLAKTVPPGRLRWEPVGEL
ncbi:hypothetical protein ACFWC5_42405 [Streptomyces sp. NPDC060085]|uniref:hypothetical protein n=1 Tax=Streptomyces sp. NPDC060085 TaxID=3347054 RepID=UPI00365CEA96